MHACTSKMNILMDFVLNKNDRRREKINNTRKTSWTLKAINLLHLWKREKKKYCAAKNGLQNSLQYSLQ